MESKKSFNPGFRPILEGEIPIAFYCIDVCEKRLLYINIISEALIAWRWNMWFSKFFQCIASSTYKWESYSTVVFIETNVMLSSSQWLHGDESRNMAYLSYLKNQPQILLPYKIGGLIHILTQNHRYTYITAHKGRAA
jgi:hypothetical protein